MTKHKRTYFLMICTAMFLCSCTITPKPLTMQDIEQRAEDDFEIMFADQEPVSGPITRYEAMARAIKYNLDHRLKVMEEALANRQFDVSHYDLLPKVVTAAGYRHRNNYSGAYSQSLVDGSQSLVASTSQERTIMTSDISMMWNVLDFGVSYLRANQQADRLLITEERRRKVIQNIILDVCDAYWRAASSERLLTEMNDLLKQTKSALERSEKIAGQRLKSPRESLEYQRSLLKTIRLLWGLIQRLDPAKTELAALMNLSPGTPYQLTAPNWESPDIPTFTNALESLEHQAMIYRPELREEDYRSRITALEARKALLKMLPGVDINLGYSDDSNKFLYHHDWWNVGARISWNIFNLFSGPVAHLAALTQQQLDNVRRQALGMAILTQVHLAHRRYYIAMEEYLVSRRLDDVNNRLNAQTAAAASAGGANEALVIQSATNALLARMRHHLAYAELQNAAGRVYHSIGTDLLPAEVEALDIASLAKALEQSFNEWNERMNTIINERSEVVSDDEISVP